MKKLYKPIALILALVVAIISGWQMTQLDLWGYRPLFFFAGAWAFILLAIESRFSRLKEGRSYLIWAVLSGVVLSAGFPPMPGFLFMFVGFVPLLYIEKKISEERGMSRWEVFKFGFVAFVTWNILTTYWVANSLFVAGLVAIVPNALLMCIPWVGFHYTRQRMGDRMGYTAFASYWILFEYIHLTWADLSWPWLTLGNSFAKFPQVVQWYEFTGAFGGTLWIMVLNLMFFHLMQKWINEGKERMSVRDYALPGATLVVPILVSLIIYATWQSKGESAQVAVIQPNYEPHYEKFTVPRSVQIRKFLALAEGIVTEDTDYLVFPETSFDNIRHNDIERHPTIESLRAYIDGYPKLKLVTGLSSYRIFEPGDIPGPTAPRIYVSAATGDTTVFEGYNSAVQMTSGDPEIPIYLKSKLVPGPEHPPLAAITRLLKPLVDALGGTMYGLGKQKERMAFMSQDGSMGVAPVICYESVYGEYVTNYVKKGATAIFIITNDGWWDNTAGHKQHMMYASLRAIETRRSIARSANTGISCFVNQRGDISSKTEYEIDAAIIGAIDMNTELTFYVRYGDLIARVAIFLSAILLLISFTRRWLSVAKKN
ncbi:MAG: apolipoprotein N-acyltransferase [Bacteroidota bacterium]